MRVRVCAAFEPRDLWIGVYWKRPVKKVLVLYVCIVPMLPIIVTLMFWRGRHWRAIRPPDAAGSPSTVTEPPAY